MRCIAVIGLFLLLAGCVPPVGDNLRRAAVAPQPLDNSPPPTRPTRTSLTPPSVGYGGTLPPIPAGGLGAEAPMAQPNASKMPTIAPAASTAPGMTTPPPSAGQSIVVPNGNGTSTVIHPDGTTETIPTPK